MNFTQILPETEAEKNTSQFIVRPALTYYQNQKKTLQGRQNK